MNLTSRESQVVQLLRQRQVAAYAELAHQLKVSGKTVQRARQGRRLHQPQRKFRLRHAQGHSPFRWPRPVGLSRATFLPARRPVAHDPGINRTVQSRMHIGGVAALAGNSRA